MSIDYDTKIGIGWIVTREEQDQMNEKTDYKYEEYFLTINCYDENSEIFFGELAPITIPAGSCQRFHLSLFEDITGDEHAYIDKWYDILARCGRSDLLAQFSPQVYILSRIS